MSLTVQQVEQFVIGEVGGFLDRCGMSITASGMNPDLSNAIGSAMRALDELPVNPVQPVDSDLAAIPDTKQELFLSICHLYALRTCAGRWAQSDQRISLGEVKANQIWEQIVGEYRRLAADLLERYGFGRRRRSPKIGAIAQGNVWPALPPPPSSAPPWPSTFTPAPGPRPNSDINNWGFNP